MEVRRSDGSVIALEVDGDQAGAPVLLCHGLADSRLCARLLAPAARALGLRLLAPDRPGTGGTDPRPLRTLAEWTEDARMVLDALQIKAAAVVGISGGGAFAAACAARLPEHVRALVLVSPLGQADWPTRGMAPGERLSLAVAARAPTFGGWFLGRLAALARRSPALFLRIATTELPEADRRELARAEPRDAFVAGYVEAFRRGHGGVAQDLRLLTRPWGFELAAIRAPGSVHYGDADTTVPAEHARRFAAAIPRAELRLHAGHGHFSLLGRGARDILAPLCE
jgi:pimeloyl-ACP methyl ester carboxylesterase